MPVKVTYSEKDGITVPYLPLFDHMRRNHGYVETRGKPENVELIPETGQSEALRLLLYDVASTQSVIASLGCDLGEGRFPKRQLSSSWQAGGYVQFLPIEEDDQGYRVLRPLAKTIERVLTDRAGGDNWEVELALTPVLLKFETEQHSRTVWVWFHALASSRTAALSSRERLIGAVREAVAVFHHGQASDIVDSIS
jgi:hypothetical protein